MKTKKLTLVLDVSSSKEEGTATGSEQTMRTLMD